MVIDSLIYALLSGDEDITCPSYPTKPSINTAVPFLTYTITNTATDYYLNGETNETHLLTVDIYSINTDELDILAEAVKDCLHMHRDVDFQLIQLTGYNNVAEETGYHAQLNFEVIHNPNINNDLSDSAGRVATGTNSVTLTACDNTLTLDCDGLQLNGEDVTANQPITIVSETDLAGYLYGNGSTISADTVITKDATNLTVLPPASNGKLILRQNPGTSGTNEATMWVTTAGGGTNLLFNMPDTNGGAGYRFGWNGAYYMVLTAQVCQLTQSQIALGTSSYLTWTDVGIHRNAAGQLTINNASSGLGGLIVRGDTTMPFVIRQSGGVAGTDELQISYNSTYNYGVLKNPNYTYGWTLADSGVTTATINRSGIATAANYQYLWTNVDNSGNANHVAVDTGLSRTAAGQVQITNGSTGLGGLIVRGDSTMPFVVRQSGGTAGDDEGRFYHDGTYLNIATSTSSSSVVQLYRELVQSNTNGYIMSMGSSSTEGTLYTNASRPITLAPSNGIVKISDTSSLSGGLSSPAKSPAQLTADTDNYAPGVGMFQRWSTDASRNITGVVAGVDGEMRNVWNVGSNNIVLKHETTSTAANRFTCSGSADITLTAGQCGMMQYSTTTSRWLVTKISA